MSSVFTRIMKRPNTTVEFYQSSDEYLQFVKEQFIDTGKCLVWRDHEFLDAEQLEIKITSIWKDRETANEVLENVSVIEDGFAQIYYNLENDIETVSVDLDGESIFGNIDLVVDIVTENVTESSDPSVSTDPSVSIDGENI